ncbi:MAG: COG1361 S-layer family protein [Candidatus Nitrosotenuis sp.]
MKSIAFVILALIVFAPVLDAYAQLGKGDSPFERSFNDIKFTNSYFGTLGNKIEVTPGDKNVPFTVVFANVGSGDITGVKGQLSLPLGFNSADGKNSLVYADSGQEVLGGRYFSLTFYVDISKDNPIQEYPGTVKVDYSRFRESGTRQMFFDFTFKVTGKSVLNLNTNEPFLTSLKNNPVTIEVTNSGTAPLSNVEILLQNTQTSVSATANPITNVESVVFDQSEWNIGTISAMSSKSFTFNVFIPENIRSETLHTPLQISYFDGHGNKVEDTRTVDFYINGLIDAKIYDIRVIELSGTQTIIGEIINEGNTNALFAFVSLEPLEGSNIKKVTQFIDELETDSPVPFNIPVEFDGESKYGDHKVKVTVRYKDDLREEHLVSEIATVTLKDTTKKPEPTVADLAPGIIGIAIAAITGFIIYKKIKKKKAERAESETH